MMNDDIPREYSDISCVNLADCVLMRTLHGTHFTTNFYYKLYFY